MGTGGREAARGGSQGSPSAGHSPGVGPQRGERAHADVALATGGCSQPSASTGPELLSQQLLQRIVAFLQLLFSRVLQQACFGIRSTLSCLALGLPGVFPPLFLIQGTFSALAWALPMKENSDDVVRGCIF